MTGHCFVSYSTADGLEFTRKLRDELEGGDPHYPVWYDKRDLAPADEWDKQIADAIESCQCFLFVMTEDSTKITSNCKTEIVHALKYGKPIVPILLHKNMEQPFLLGSREWIDFTGGFKAGVARLRNFLRELDSPEGILRALKYRLADAEHILRRGKDEEENQIKAEIAALKAQIQLQEDVLKSSISHNLNYTQDNAEKVVKETKALQMHSQNQEIIYSSSLSNEKIKHLEMIQNVITKMHNDSNQVKRLTIISVATLLSVFIFTKNNWYVLVAFLPTIVFWFLDTYYLWQQRKFRGVYDDVAGITKNNEIKLFAMRPDLYTGGKYSYFSVFFSVTILWVYLPVIGILLGIYFLL